MGQDAAAFRRAGIGNIDDWEVVEAPARRRRWYDSASGTLAVLIASGSDLDDLIPTLVAYQIEFNKLRRLAPSTVPRDVDAAWCAQAIGGDVDDWHRLQEAWDGGLPTFLAALAQRELNLRIRMLGGSEVGYARVTRRWWEPVRTCLRDRDLHERPLYFVSSNTHSLANLLTGSARQMESEILAWVQRSGPAYLQEERRRFAQGDNEGSWENFLYYCGRLLLDLHGPGSALWERRRAHERAAGLTHIPSQTALRVAIQVIDLSSLRPEDLDPRLGAVDLSRLADRGPVIVNIDYPLGLAAYNVLREIGTATEALCGVYVLGKAATLNADVGVSRAIEKCWWIAIEKCRSSGGGAPAACAAI